MNHRVKLIHHLVRRSSLVCKFGESDAHIKSSLVNSNCFTKFQADGMYSSITPSENFLKRGFSISREELVKRRKDSFNRRKKYEEIQQVLARYKKPLHSTEEVIETHQPTKTYIMQQQRNLDLSGLTNSTEQPSPTQSLTGPLKPKNFHEGKLASLVARPDLMITRSIEYLNIFMGLEQQNRYTIVDPHKAVTVGFLLEESNFIWRQLLRTHRPWKVNVFDATGDLLCLIQRNFFLINSTASVEIDGKVVGWVHRRWHLWKRNYDVYTVNEEGKKVQFAAMENAGFWWWTFTLKDSNGDVLGVIDRDFRGLGLELFTDAGQYFVRFGDMSRRGEAIHSGDLSSGPLQEGTTMETHHKLQAIAQATENIPPLQVQRHLTLVERAVALALAVSIDNDFFSRHSNRSGIFHFGGWGTSE